MRVVTTSQMRKIEENSLKYDMTYQRLMENAGSAAATFIRGTFKLEGLNCMVFCGSGNNGGDGFVAARKLIENGANVLVALVGGEPRSDEAKTMYKTIELMGMPVLKFDESFDKVMEILEKADIIVDAIYGTGFRGGLGRWEKAACVAINNAIAAVVSLDVPSGVECDSGKVAADAVTADFTVAFDSLKPVHILPEGKLKCGKIEVVEIGIPEEAYAGITGMFGDIYTEDVLRSLKKREQERDTNKGDYGKLLIIAGCGRYRGSAALATLAALRCGTGFVTLASTKPVCDATSAKLYECIYIELPEGGSQSVSADNGVPLLRESLKTSTAVLFGCGMGNNEDTERLMEYLVRNTRCPLIIDADGINVMTANINILKEAAGPVILTPHPGEMARICSETIGEIQRDRSGTAIKFAEKYKAYIVLKGHNTVIASPKGELLTNRSGNPGLAKAGSGDVLAGMIAAFAAQGLSPFEAAAAGVHLHGLAADEAAKELSQYAMLPSDLPDYLAKILAENGR